MSLSAALLNELLSRCLRFGYTLSFSSAGAIKAYLQQCALSDWNEIERSRREELKERDRSRNSSRRTDDWENEMLDDEEDEEAAIRRMNDKLKLKAERNLDELLKHIQNSKIVTPNIDESHVQAAINSITKERVAEAAAKVPTRNSKSLSLAPSTPAGNVSSSTTAIAASLIPPVHECIRVVDAFEMPRLKYDEVKKTFVPASSVSTSASTSSLAPAESSFSSQLHSSPNEKISMYRDRFSLVHQRILRSTLFAPPVSSSNVASTSSGLFASQLNDERPQLTPLNALVSSAGESKWVLGMLTALEEGKWWLEDDSYAVAVDLQQMKYVIDCFYVDHSFVIARGMYDDHTSRFIIEELGMPPVETRRHTLASFPQLDLFQLYFSKHYGARKIADLDEEKHTLRSLCLNSAQYAQLSAGRARPQPMLVLLSEVHLDVPKSFARLEKLLKKFAEKLTYPPACFILCGNFFARYGHDSAVELQRMKSCFDALADLIASFPFYRLSTFIFVPGPNDPCKNHNSTTLPRPSLSSFYTQRLKDRLPHVHFASNPCRILYFHLEIAVIRDDLLHTMKMQAVVRGKQTHKQDKLVSDANVSGSDSNSGMSVDELSVDDYTKRDDFQLVRTLTEQGHLCPFPLSVRPIYWRCDSALRLYPLPDVLFVCDSYERYRWDQSGCDIGNPSSFTRDGQFIVFWPDRSTLQDRIEFGEVDKFPDDVAQIKTKRKDAQHSR